MTIPHVTELDVINAMSAGGNHFERHLGEACRVADHGTVERIRYAFPDIWLKFLHLVIRAKGGAK